VIRRFRRRLLEAAEREPTDTLIDSVIRHFLYAPRDTAHGTDAEVIRIQIYDIYIYIYI